MNILYLESADDYAILHTSKDCSGASALIWAETIWLEYDRSLC